MAEGLRADVAGGVALQGVVADRGGGGQGLLDIARLEQLALLGRVGPHAGVAVGLELEPDRGALGSLRAARALDPVRGAEQVLEVVADLVGDDVGLREVPGGAEAVLEGPVEAEVDVHALVAGAVKGAGGGLAGAAGGVDGPGEQNQLGALVGGALDRREPVPGGLHVVEDEADKGRLLVARGGGRLALHGALTGALGAAEAHTAEVEVCQQEVATDKHDHAEPPELRADQGEQDADAATTPATATHAAHGPTAAMIDDVVAAMTAVPKHGAL